MEKRFKKKVKENIEVDEAGKRPTYDIVVDHSIRGIPCKIGILSYSPGRSSRDPYEPDDPPEIEYDLLDRKGYVANWLLRKLSKAELNNIESAAYRAAEEEENQRQIDYYERSRDDY